MSSIAWVCIAASVIGVVLLIVDALRERSAADVRRRADADGGRRRRTEFAEDYPEEARAQADGATEAETSRCTTTAGEDGNSR